MLGSFVGLAFDVETDRLTDTLDAVLSAVEMLFDKLSLNDVLSDSDVDALSELLCDQEFLLRELLALSELSELLLES